MTVRHTRMSSDAVNMWAISWCPNLYCVQAPAVPWSTQASLQI